MRARTTNMTRRQGFISKFEFDNPEAVLDSVRGHLIVDPGGCGAYGMRLRQLNAEPHDLGSAWRPLPDAAPAGRPRSMRRR